ncbi:MAG: YjjG family noncanonical pyrimidine nucleotidase [Spirosomaceae bacterium]|jgi:putative hydrolase of the HAD superfamily|nr:YjjG family noncanonical pyrimidine nucleotidase [Spirosomataceae bacterium]
MKYTHLFFDLDHTLWDFERNSAESLAELYENHKLKSLGINDLSDFQSKFSEINQFHWNLLDKNLITHDELRRRRFADTLNALGVEADEDFGLKLNEDFLKLLPHKPHLIEGAIEILDYLAPKYELHIISNGWLDIQFNKMNSSKITHYFGEVITNERANARKPDPKIFEYAVGLTNASLSNSLMIGDNYEADILGAKSAGMDSVYFNPETFEATDANYTINHLLKLKNIL